MELEMETEKICLQLPISVMSSKAIQRNVSFLSLLAGRVTDQGRRHVCSEPYWEESCELRCIPELQGLLMPRGMMGLLQPRGMMGLRQPRTGEDKSEDLFSEMADAIRRVSRWGDQSGIMEQSLCQQGIKGGTSEKTLKSECHQEKGVRTQSENWCQWKLKRMASEERRKNDKRSFSRRLHWVNSNPVSAAFSQNLCTEKRGEA